MENYREIYNSLVAGSKKPADYTVEQLFELASCLAVDGDFTGKKRVYAGFISTHPLASADDKWRVIVYLARARRI